jgi:hypothetical protein
MFVLNVGAERFEQVRDALAMFRADRNRLAEPEAKGIEDSRFTGVALGLVGNKDDGCGFGSEPTTDFLIDGRDALPSVDEEHRNIGVANRRFGLRAHAPRERIRILVLKPGGVDDPKVEAKQLRFAFPAITGYAGPVVDQREALADEAVEER